MANTPTMNFQAYLEDAWKIIRQEPLIMIGGGLLFQLLFFATQGIISIIAGPLLGGYLILIILYLREGKRPAFSDLFIGFKRFYSLFSYFLVLLTILIGFALLILPGLLFATWWIYVLPLMVDREMTFSVAMKTSMDKVNERGFFMHLVFLLLVTLVPILLLNTLVAVMPALMVLTVLLPPIQFGCLASLYLDQFRPEEPVAAPEPAQEPAAPDAEDSAPGIEGAAGQAGGDEANPPAAEKTPGNEESEGETRPPSAVNDADAKQENNRPG